VGTNLQLRGNTGVNLVSMEVAAGGRTNGLIEGSVEELVVVVEGTLEGLDVGSSSINSTTVYMFGRKSSNCRRSMEFSVK